MITINRDEKRRHNSEQGVTIAIDYNTLSHELRTPFVGILGMTELLAGEKLSTTQKEKIAIIRTSAERLLIFINTILKTHKTRETSYENRFFK